jgi:hypothetical protein
MNRTAFTLAAAALVAGCSTAPIKTDAAREVPADQVLVQTAPAPGATAQIVVKRDMSMYGGACPNSVMVNGKPYARMWTGERVTLHLPAGSVLLGVQTVGALCPSDARELRIELKAGEQRTFVMSMPFMQSPVFAETAL